MHVDLIAVVTTTLFDRDVALRDVAIYVVGWWCGWLLLWRLRPLPPAPGRCAPVAVVIPARNEALSLPALLGPLVAQRRDGDEIVVVDDDSVDDTAGIASTFGVQVVSPPALPAGWLGKPHACWTGAQATTASTLVFLDADVRVAPDLLDRLAQAVDEHPESVVSVQPWHATERFVEQASMLCNVTALMGCGAFTALGHRVHPIVAFGPVLAVGRDVYEHVGGQADPTVRQMHTEDIGLARAVGAATLFTGRPDTTFRMYPDGLAHTLTGWRRSLATGARYVPWWLALATFAWVCSLAGGWLVAPIVYPLSAAQVWVLGRRAGSIHPLTALLYPLAVLAFAYVFVRSALAMMLRRPVEWKGRDIETR